MASATPTARVRRPIDAFHPLPWYPPMPPKRYAAACVLLLATLPGLAAASTQAPPLEGAWQLVSGEYVDADGRVVDYADKQLQGMKLLADGRFSFTTTAAGRFWAGGSGTFSADGTQYVETPRMASYPLAEGGQYRFDYTLEGDTWTLERHEGGRRVEREVWRRVGASAD